MRKFFNHLKDFSDRPWYLPFICLLAFADFFVVVIPTDALIVTTSIMKPKRWLITAITVTTASALGSLALGTFGRYGGEPFVGWIMGKDFFSSANWIRMSEWIDHYGFWGLSFIALGPLPAQPAILVCALAHMKLPEITAAVFLGRAPKYFLLSYLATHSPKWFKKVFKKSLAEVQAE